MPIPQQKPVFILDSSAVLRYLDAEPGCDRVIEILRSLAEGSSRALICALHWGEIALRLYRSHGEIVQISTMNTLLLLGIEIAPVTAEQAVRSALIRARHRISYVDAFGIELAKQITNSVFVTADYNFKPAAAEARIEFLPAK